MTVEDFLIGLAILVVCVFFLALFCVGYVDDGRKRR